MKGRSKEDRDAAGEEGVREVSAGLLVPGHDQAELGARHVLQPLGLRLSVRRVLLEVRIRACHLSHTQGPSVYQNRSFLPDRQAACDIQSLYGIWETVISGHNKSPCSMPSSAFTWQCAVTRAEVHQLPASPTVTEFFSDISLPWRLQLD